MRRPVADLVARLESAGLRPPAGRVRADGYGDSPEMSQALIELIRTGPKRAGTGHQAGDIEIVVDHLDEPVLS